MIHTTPENLSIAAMWTDFAAHTVPAEAPPIQRIEMRKAFFAGFLQALIALQDVAHQMPEDEATKVLSKLEDEAVTSLKIREGRRA